MKESLVDSTSVVVLGAGLAGLTAARRLASSERAVTVIDKGRGVGGRLATRRITAGDRIGVFDHGAQFFTARDPKFSAQVAEWLREGVAQEWSRGFAVPGKPYLPDGHPRYSGRTGMTALAKHMAGGLDVRLGARAVAVIRHPEDWEIVLENGERLRVAALVLTSPVPQSLALLDAGGVALRSSVLEMLQALEYEPCLALLILLDGPSYIPEPGGLQPGGGIIAWIADNYRKGISLSAGAVTIHGETDFSHVHWNSDDETVMQAMLQAARSWLDAPVLRWEVKRWRYARPRTIFPDPFLVVSSDPSLVLAGDIFGGPRVEGAYLSGLAAAEWLLTAQH